MPEMNEYNAQALAAEVAGDLFPKDGNAGEGQEPAVGGSGTPAPSSPQEAQEKLEAGQMTPDEYAALPKSWKKEMETVWKTAPKELREYVYRREADVTRGIQQYHAGHQQWSNLVSPFQQLFQQYPQVNPVQLMQNLMHAHLGLISGSPEERRERALRIIKDYGIDLAEQQAAQNQPEPWKAHISTLEQQLARQEQVLRTMAQSSYDAEVAQQTKAVEKFAETHPHFEELGPSILHLLKTGAAPDLETAYEMAAWATPAVRAKLLAQQAQQAGGNTPDKARKPLNVDGTGAAKPAGRKPASLDETVDSVVAKYANSM